MARGTTGSGGGSRARGFSRSGFRGSTHFRGGRGRGRGRGGAPAENQPQREDDGTQLAERFEQVRLQDEIDEKLGFSRISEGVPKAGWLVNMHPVSIIPSFTYMQRPLNSLIDTCQGFGVCRRKGCCGLLLYSR
jgi:DNA polymerase epsilon subunit 1